MKKKNCIYVSNFTSSHSSSIWFEIKQNQGEQLKYRIYELGEKNEKRDPTTIKPDTQKIIIIISNESYQKKKNPKTKTPKFDYFLVF